MSVSVILINYPVIPIAYVLYGGKKCWITTDTLSYRLSNGQNYTVEKGLGLMEQAHHVFYGLYFLRLMIVF